MKIKFVLSFTLALVVGSSFAFAHTILRDASTLSRGKIPNERLDYSSVTLLGSNPTFTSFIGAQQAVVIVGTSSVRGATIITTTTAGINIAIASSTNRGGNVFIQAGNYGPTDPIGVNENVTLIWESSAVLKFNQNDVLRNIFIVSGTVITPTIDISTSLYSTSLHTALFDFKKDGKVFYPDLRLHIGTYISANAPWRGPTLGAFLFGPQAIGAILDHPNISTFTFLNPVGSSVGLNLFVVNGASQSQIIEPTINGNQTNVSVTNEGWFNIMACDGFQITGGNIKLSERLLGVGPNAGTPSGLIKNFSWKGGNIYNFANTDATSGIITFESETVDFSTGNEVSGMTIQHMVNVTNPTFSTNAQVGKVNGALFTNNTVLFMAGSTGAAFKISGVNDIFTIIRDNSVFGTSTFISDSGTQTRYTTLGNFLNGVQQ